MKIGIVSQYYPPEPANIPAQLAEGLRDRGHDVRVITGYPNYPEGKLYPSFKRRKREIRGGIRVRRIPLFIDHSQSALKRMLNYVSFGFSVAAHRRLLADCDIIYVYATQPTPALGLMGLPYVLHVQDLWPDTIVGSGMTGRAGRVIERALTPWLRRLYQRARAVIGISPTMTGTLVRRGAPADRAHFVYNWANEGVTPTGENLLPRRGIVYAGNLGEMQALDTVVEAARISGEHVYLVGAGTQEAHLREIAPENVTFVGRVQPEQMGDVNAQSDFQVVSLRDLPLFRFTIPSKTQNALAAGIPVIAAVPGDVAHIITENGLGFAVPPEDPEALAEAFQAAAALSDEERAAMGVRARQYYEANMSLQAGIDQIETILEAQK